MSLFSSPQENAANGPETWEVRRSGRVWQVVTKSGTVIEHAVSTRRGALELKESGMYVRMYEQERRWYAGETPTGQRSYSECLADRARMEERRSAKAMAP